MTDYPIPDDLLAHLSLDAGVIAANGVPSSSTVHVSAAVLAALAEWADGALIDPNGWRRLDAETVGHGSWRGDELYAREDEPPADPQDWFPLYTLTDRGDQ